MPRRVLMAEVAEGGYALDPEVRLDGWREVRLG